MCNFLWQTSFAVMLSLANNTAQLDVSIEGSKIFVNGQLLPLGRYPDEVYDKILGPHSHKSQFGELIWERKGIILQRRRPELDCMVIASFFLGDYMKRVPTGLFLKNTQSLDGTLRVEGVLISEEHGLPELKAKTKQWSSVSPFGYWYHPPGKPRVGILVGEDYHYRKLRNGFVDVTSSDFDSACEK